MLRSGDHLSTPYRCGSCLTYLPSCVFIKLCVSEGKVVSSLSLVVGNPSDLNGESNPHSDEWSVNNATTTRS